MAKADSFSPAPPIHRIVVGNIHLSIFDGHSFTLQRRYVHNDQRGFAHSFRENETEDIRQAIDEYKRWLALRELNEQVKSKKK